MSLDDNFKVDDFKAGYIIACLQESGLRMDRLDVTAKDILFRTVAAFQPKR